jgi:hypothetical protein
MLAPILTVVVLLAYAAALWWLLRRESPTVLMSLLAICALALCLRLVYTTDYPAGLNEDEPKILRCATEMAQAGNLTPEGCTGLPALLSALFQGQLVPLIGPNRWAIRLYSLVTSVLACAVAFAVGRSLGMRAGPSLGVAACIAVLPWSLFYGRISIGGELTFHELLLLAALARLIVAGGSWPEMAIGILGQSLLLYDYFCGRTVLPISLVGAVLATGRRRLFCLGIPLVALLLWTPYLRTNPANALGGVMINLLHPGFTSEFLTTLQTRLPLTLKAFLYPAGLNATLTVAAAAMHPPVILVVAACGVLIALRRARVLLFLLGGFVIGIAPAVVTNSAYPSTHRMMMAYPFIALAAGIAVDKIPWARWRVAATALLVAVTGVQSIQLYFSSTFWSPASSATFDWELTALVEALPKPPHGTLVVSQQVSYYAAPLNLVDPFVFLSADNWYPADGKASLYAFSRDSAPLRPFYDQLFGPERIVSFGRAFMVKLEATEWSWLRQHGWSYEVRCGAQVRRGQVPTLFHPGVTFEHFPCAEPTLHTWRGHWVAPAASLRLRSSGRAEVQAGSVYLSGGQGSFVDFKATPETDIVISVTMPAATGLWAALFEVARARERVPIWESVVPAGVQEAVGAAVVPSAPEATPTALEEIPDDLASLRKMALEDGDPEHRVAAVMRLGDSEGPQVISILTQALQDPDEDVRIEAIQALGGMTGDVPVDTLGRAALTDPSPENRCEALDLLSEASGKAARAFIEKAINDPDEDVSDLAKSLLEDDDMSDTTTPELPKSR